MIAKTPKTMLAVWSLSPWLSVMPPLPRALVLCWGCIVVVALLGVCVMSAAVLVENDVSVLMASVNEITLLVALRVERMWTGSIRCFRDAVLSGVQRREESWVDEQCRSCSEGSQELIYMSAGFERLPTIHGEVLRLNRRIVVLRRVWEVTARASSNSWEVRVSIAGATRTARTIA